MGEGCRDCRAGVAHCHGTLIQHWPHHAECTDDDCVVPELVAHVFVIDCDAIGCDCAQPIGSADLDGSSWRGAATGSG